MATPDFLDIERDTDPAVVALRSAVREALSHLPVDRILRIVASVIWRKRRENFVKGHAVSEIGGMGQFVMVPGSLASQSHDPAEFPHHTRMALDHRTAWRRNGKPCLVISEPYFASKDELRELIAYCDTYGIDFQVDAESMYYPGHAIRILFKKGRVAPSDATAHEDD